MKKITLETLEITSFIIPTKDAPVDVPVATDANSCWSMGYNCTNAGGGCYEDPDYTNDGAYVCSRSYLCGSGGWDCNLTGYCSRANDCYV